VLHPLVLRKPRLSDALFFEQVRQAPSRIHSEGHARIDRARTPESCHRSLRVRFRERLRVKQPALVRPGGALKHSRVQFKRFDDTFAPLFNETDVVKGEP
jgi:hypothetical protein